MKNQFINRDISWLFFNERVLKEASKDEVPLLERLKFLSIYSSNLDEFYRVRVPALIALHQIEHKEQRNNTLTEVNAIILKQQQLFGSILRDKLLPLLREQHIEWLYRQPIPQPLKESTKHYFLTRLAAFLQTISLSDPGTFFPGNNKIYLAISVTLNDIDDIIIVNIPAAECGRFHTETVSGIQYIVMMDDIIRDNIASIVPPGAIVKGCYSFKITRDAELDLEDEYKGDIAEKIEQQIVLRDLGLATRLLYDAAMPHEALDRLIEAFQLGNATIVEGGTYHNLKDLSDFPAKRDTLSYEKWPSVKYTHQDNLFEHVKQKDILLHVPYHSYNPLLQLFNQASIDPLVTDISITLYRIAGDSQIANALINAAGNGKNVTVFVELKARFDEANNIRWAKKMKAAGVKIIYSIPGLKVHAKVALIKRNCDGRSTYYGVFATGNFNETTARFYTDHILITANKGMLRELELLFIFLGKRRKPEEQDKFPLQHLLIAQFNLQSEFLRLIADEIALAKQGLPAEITIKLNNLEEETLISKLYEASQAGVKINLLVRGICRLKPQVPGLSDNITVKRIVDRYLEHGRIFIFHSNGTPKVYLGSSDWMNRNIYRRIEVCFPVYSAALKEEIIKIVQIQLADNTSAVLLNDRGENTDIPKETDRQIHSQNEIYQMIKMSAYE